MTTPLTTPPKASPKLTPNSALNKQCKLETGKECPNAGKPNGHWSKGCRCMKPKEERKKRSPKRSPKLSTKKSPVKSKSPSSVQSKSPTSPVKSKSPAKSLPPFLRRNIRKAQKKKGARKKRYYEFDDDEEDLEDMEDSEDGEDEEDDLGDLIVDDDEEDLRAYREEREKLMQSQKKEIINELKDRLKILKGEGKEGENKGGLKEILQIEAEKRARGKELNENERALKMQILSTIQQTEEKLKKLLQNV
jgi:hypothetical protein